MNTDPYATLGLTPEASDDDIKRAYRKLARKYHPDVSKEPQAEARFKEIAQAYEAVGTAEARAAFEEQRRRPRGWPGGGSGGGPGAGGFAAGMDASDLFDSLFRRGTRRGAPAAQPGADQHAELPIDLHEAYQGSRRTLNQRVPVTDALGRSVLQDRQLEVRVPRGTSGGQQLRLAGQGAPGIAGGAPGDLYLQVVMRPHPRFRVDGREVTVELPLAPWEAALGASVAAPTPEGPVQLSVPANSRAGRKLRLKGRGIPGQGSQPTGDLYVLLAIVLPPVETTAEREACEAWARAFPDWNPRPADD